jgi:hypothetical protein
MDGRWRCSAIHWISSPQLSVTEPELRIPILLNPSRNPGMNEKIRRVVDRKYPVKSVAGHGLIIFCSTIPLQCTYPAG